MNKFLKTIVFIIMSSSLLLSCNQDIDKFENMNNYIYFGALLELDEFGVPKNPEADSVEYSFVYDDISVKTYTFKILVNTIGLVNEQERPYNVNVIDSLTTAESKDWVSESIENTSIKKGKLTDTLLVTVNRTDILSEESKIIALELSPNDNFMLGDKRTAKIRLVFSDLFFEPGWWKGWQGYFGAYRSEVFIKWQEIYTLGADPNKDADGKLYYWDNMPPHARPDWYPSTFMFVRVLKQHFLDNVVYPNGDTSKPRILLP